MLHKRHFLVTFIMLALLATGTVTQLSAQTRSRIAGSVKEADTGKPLAGVNVFIENTYLGAVTDEKGNFIIINVPVGTYDLKASMMGYSAQVMRQVMVSTDRITRVEFILRSEVIAGEEVVVTAQRDELHKEVSNTQLVVSDVQLHEATGIREINAFLTKLPGVSEDNGYLTIRGGSADQTGMMVNGLSYTNLGTGNAETSIPLSAIEQVSLLSGGYNAEYGNFRSGLINVTTKSGSKERYHGSFSYSLDQSHRRRFGESFYSPQNPVLRPYLDPEVAFLGTQEAWADDPYIQQQHLNFAGWNYYTDLYNLGKAPEDHATPLDYYLLACWMHMTIPDYEGLSKLGYTVPAEQKELFEEHAMKEDGSDWNFDGGFGGPVPLIGKKLGNATFYISNNSREQHYIMPVTLRSENIYTTLATIKSQPSENLTLTFNGLYKYQKGISPIRPAWGDFPDASREGGFMPLNNIKHITRNPEYWYDPPFFPILKQNTLMGGLTINHVLNPSTFWELSLSALRIKNDSPTGNNRDQTVLTYFGPFPVSEMPYGKLQYGSNILDGYNYPSYDALPGIPRRFRRKEGDLYDNSKVNQYRVRFEMASQLDIHHYVKGGFEYNYIDLDHKLWEKWNENYYNVYEFNYHRTPSQTGIFIQDQLNFEAIIANLGLRFDYYYGGGGKWPTGDPFAEEVFTPQDVAADSILFQYLEQGRSYIWDTWVAYDKENPGFLKPIKNHYAISPRIGISFPVTVNSKFYFNYGHFRSNPPYYTMYLYRYRYDKNGLYDMSNPNLEPPRTISYEMGMAYNFRSSYVMRISGYSKDVTGQHGEVNFRNATGSVDYDKWVNNEYEDIQGLELNLSKSDNSWLNGWVNFNYMLKKSGLTGREEITEVTINNDREGLYAGQESRSLPVPELNANITFRSPSNWGPDVFGTDLLGNWNLTFFAEWETGDYFTWNPNNELHVSDNMRWPDYHMVDMKLTKTFKWGGIGATLFLDV
ncbi:TonB-dependent receptor, partial [candidate division KSB1 bacterium]|nr:TonB-dependent receptor [candidate division KSB1 bacterium]